jgi:hypothetical protein
MYNDHDKNIMFIVEKMYCGCFLISFVSYFQIVKTYVYADSRFKDENKTICYVNRQELDKFYVLFEGFFSSQFEFLTR